MKIILESKTTIEKDVEIGSYWRSGIHFYKVLNDKYTLHVCNSTVFYLSSIEFGYIETVFSIGNPIEITKDEFEVAFEKTLNLLSSGL